MSERFVTLAELQPPESEQAVHSWEAQAAWKLDEETRKDRPPKMIFFSIFTNQKYKSLMNLTGSTD